MWYTQNTINWCNNNCPHIFPNRPIYTVSQKMSLFCFAITSTHELILIIFGTNITEEVCNQKIFIYQSHLTSTSALPAEIGNPETASS